MPARWIRLVAMLSGFLFADLLHAQFTYPLRQHDDMEAQLTVEVGKHTAERGLGEVTLTLTITGPPTLIVEEPRLGDAAAAWKEERLASTRTVKDQRLVWSQVIRLHQVKRGLEPVPDVTVRFRRNPEAEWIEEEWPHILQNIRDGSEPLQQVEETPSWQRRWGFIFFLAVFVLLVSLAWMKKRTRFRHEAPLPSDRWALQEIDRIERTLMPPQGEAEAYHTQISFVVRRYLVERFGLHALQQTTAEFLQAARQLAELPPEEQALLSELFERCDLAKFARAGSSPEECLHTTELARSLVQRTTKQAIGQHKSADGLTPTR